MTDLLQLRRFARVVNGGTPTNDERNWNGQVPWATPIDLARRDGGVIGETDRYLTSEGLRSGSASVPAGSVLISTRAPIGYVALTERACAFNQGCKGLVPLPEVDARFLRYWLSAQRDDLQASGSGSTFLELSASALAAYPVPRATEREQRRISDFLDDQVTRIDKMISARTLQIELVAQMQRAYAEKMFSAHPAKAWRLGRILRMGAVGVVVNPSSYFADEGVPFVHGFNVRDGWFDLTILKKMSADDCASLPRSRLSCGDVLVVRAGYPGRAAVVTPDLAGGNCASVLLLRPDAHLLPGWLEAFFNCALGKRQVDLAQYGSAQGVINLSDVRNFRLPLPSVSEQAAALAEFSAARRALADGRARLVASTNGLHELKRSLITAAVAGEFDVSTADGSRLPV